MQGILWCTDGTNQIHRKPSAGSKNGGFGDRFQPGETIVVFTAAQGLGSLGYEDPGYTNCHRACRKYEKAELVSFFSLVI